MTTFHAKLYVITLLAFFALDMVWLVIVARGFYQARLGHLLAAQPNWPAAIVFYLLFILGVVVFVILPALQNESLARALVLGAFFGLVTYATYDLTNLATLKDWPLAVAIVDMTWGAVLGASVSGVGFAAGRWLQ